VIEINVIFINLLSVNIFVLQTESWDGSIIKEELKEEEAIEEHDIVQEG